MVLSRDVRGVKPLYYGKKENFIYFSSEIKSFINSGVFKEIDNYSLQQFLSAGYVFNNSSSLKDVSQLHPGETIEIIENKIVNRFQRNQKVFDDNNKHEIKDIPKFVRNKIVEAVERQLVSDVPVGLLLSSGIDSMSILASIKLLNKLDQTNTYTAYYPSKEFSENTLVEKLAKKWNFKNYSVKILPEDVYNNLNGIFKTFDNLDFIPVSAIKYILSNFSDKKNKVLLSGAGGDEIFCSYATHLASSYRQKININNLSFLKNFAYFFERKKFDGSHLNFQRKY